MIDWHQLVLNLIYSVGTAPKVQHKYGIHRQTLDNIKQFKTSEPKWSTGLKMLDAHLKECGIEKHRKLLQLSY